MKLSLVDHDYKYAVEAILLTLFPDERPEYVEQTAEGTDNQAVVRLSRGRQFVTAVTHLTYGGRTADGSAKVSISELTDKLAEDRLLQKIVKLSFYRAAVDITGKQPVWGALTGIRPGKIATRLLESGATPEQTLRTMEREYYVSPDRATLTLDTAMAGLQVKNALQPKDICLYVGIPFCPTRCAYCSFVSQSVEKTMKLIDPFLEALFKEIDATAAAAKALGLRVISVYVGGGTPTTLSAAQLDSLISRLRAAFDFRYVQEFCVEAGRPDTVTPEKLQVLEKGGVNRISVNPQTMSDAVLEAIGRRHTAADIRTAMAMVRDNCSAMVNMDLIAGLPTDTVDGFKASLDAVLALNPENVTVHTLSLKKGTRITLEETPLPSPEAVGTMLDYANGTLHTAGYAPYYLYRQKFISGGFENVGWSRPGTESLYNVCIMEELCTILAMGGGASTKLVAPTGRIERIFDPKYPFEYIERIDQILEGKAGIGAFYRETGMI